MSLLWKTATTLNVDDPIFHGYKETHEEHSLHPAFKAAGMRQAPCSSPWCNAYDEGHADVQNRAESKILFKKNRDAAWTDHSLDLKKPVYGMESHADEGTLDAYTKDPSSRNNTRGGTAWGFKHKGEFYLQNGHHGVAAAMRRGDSHYPVKLIDMDKES